jgi:hypothetical protein
MSKTEEINEEIIKKQDEIIEILKDLCQGRDKYIALLEKQLAITEKYINNEQQQ